MSECTDNVISKQNESKSIKASEVTFIGGGKEVVIGVIRMFNANEHVLLNHNSSYFNINNVLSVKPVDIEVCPNCDGPIESTDLYADGGAVAKVKRCTGCGWSNGGQIHK
ncbi:hypothetical protein [Bacillus mycoides]|uniref:hypothetical protein n=1 Tax=Bacillus mycoides TaxID=1405 RepID=UPI003D20F323